MPSAGQTLLSAQALGGSIPLLLLSGMSLVKLCSFTPRHAEDRGRSADSSALQDICLAVPGEMRALVQILPSARCHGAVWHFARRKNDVPATERYSLYYTKDRVTRENIECRQRG